MNSIPLALRLKTKNTFLGRLQNIHFIASEVIVAIFRYYWNGPKVPSWCLRFHIIHNVLRQYLSQSLPHNMPNEAASEINFDFIADYIDMNNLPCRPLKPHVGYNQEHNIIIDASNCKLYSVSRYGLSSEKLDALAAADIDAARRNQPRRMTCQVLFSAQHSRFQNPHIDEMLDIKPMHADERIILHFHGGAYCVGERSLTHIHVYARISQATGLRVFSPNYRLAPRHCFPSQLHDCFLSYSYILSCGFKPENIVLSGDSAGGALAIGVLFLLRDMKLAMPKATVLISPWVDATCSGKSWKTSQHLDYLPLLHLEDPFHPTRMFYDPGRTFSSEMRKELQCPLVSPVFGTDLSGLPPMLIQMGSNERLRDDIQLFADKVKLHNPKAKPALEIYDNMPHAFVLFDFAEAAQQAFASIGGFVSRIKPLK